MAVIMLGGETEEKSDYSEDTYKYLCDEDGDGVKEYVNIGNNISGTEYDEARQKWGGSWRMPTKEEFNELLSKCTWTWMTYKGINGYKVTGPNGDSIFLPAVGSFVYTTGAGIGETAVFIGAGRCTRATATTHAHGTTLL